MINSEDETAIRQLGNAWDRAWNSHDMKALGSLVTPNVDFVHVLGGSLGGREVFERYHAERHATQFKASSTHTDGMAIRPLTPDICLVHRYWHMIGDTALDGTSRQSARPGLRTWIVRRDGARWLIDAAHNTNIVTEAVGPEYRKPVS